MKGSTIISLSFLKEGGLIRISLKENKQRRKPPHKESVQVCKDFHKFGENNQQVKIGNLNKKGHPFALRFKVTKCLQKKKS